MAYPSPTFSISTQCLHISHFLPDSPKHCAFLARLYNTDDFIQSCGRTGIDTPDKAARFLQTRVAADFARNGYGIYLVSRKPYDYADAPLAACTPVGTVSLMKGEGEPPNA